MSDHYPIFAIKKREHQGKEFTYVFRRSLANFDLLAYQIRLQSLDWSVLVLIKDVNVKWTTVKKALVFDADRFCPVVRVKIRKVFHRRLMGKL